ncbi:aspartate ammonia-lyase, partial [Candidatus Peregrinibacteria bacterium]|nr:aspartate ammonia-lyase [Candidatus Peregrinibacteria bacterium]
MRTEEDSLGRIKVPKEAYYGTTTARALRNFQISGQTAPNVFREGLGLVKLAAAKTNCTLKELDEKPAKAIMKAAEEFIEGKFNSDFKLDVLQAGAGTSYNMNANEIIANRANELLKAPKGSYAYVHPNNHVNMAQSTNDVMPTATRIAILLSLPELLKSIGLTESSLEKIAKKYAKLIKVGRTHNQDAVPITLGQEFDSYAEALRKSREFIEERSIDLQTLGIGGTAVGTGINAHPKYQSLMIKILSLLTGVEFKAGKNLTELANNMNAFMNFSSSLK